MVLQQMYFINKTRATDLENTLILEAWKSLATMRDDREGVSFVNLVSFVLLINNIFPKELQMLEING